MTSQLSAEFFTASTLSLLLVLFYQCTTASASTSTVVVDAPFGKIRGEVVEGHPTYVAFRNIPYAKPPVGDLRFAKPQPHPESDGEFDATDNREIRCVHAANMHFTPGVDSEDCLLLHVFAKAIEPDKSKKVLVYIHGGAFVAGSAAFLSAFSFIAGNDIIAVSLNYRLGILGFLSTGNEVAPGNLGLWDQALALRWVKDNIKAFGGNPDDVTITGESAGGCSVGLHSISPLSKGLFSKVWASSGAASSSFSEAIHVQKHALEFAKHAKCWDAEITDELDLEQSERLIQCLRNVPDITVFSSFLFASQGEPQFVPRVDGEFIPRKTVLLLQDELYLESIGFYDRSYLFSINNNEYAITKTYFDMFVNMIQTNNETTDEQKRAIIDGMNSEKINHFLLSRSNPADDSSLVIEKVSDFYRRRYEEYDVIVRLVTDLAFLIPAYDSLNAASAQGNRCKAWFLYFDYFPAFAKGKHKGILHGAEGLFWRDATVADVEKLLFAGLQGEMDEDDLRLKSLFSSLIIKFMEGDPGAALKELLPSGWPTYDPDNAYYLNFNLEPSVRSRLDPDTYDLWFNKVPKWQKKTDKNSHEHSEL